MSPADKEMYALRLDTDLRQMLKKVKERDGISESEQIRRALKLWFVQKGGSESEAKVVVEAGRPRVVSTSSAPNP